MNESERIPARDAFGRGESGDPVVLTRRGPGRNEALLLPVEATAVWQRHLAQQEAEREQRAQEEALGERLPTTQRVPATTRHRRSSVSVYTGQRLFCWKFLHCCRDPM
ncbi:hypothetical protein ACIHFD_59225 [Nonomuraea sp. NPDC051941]|uniref:hypothetical protein n=1 Tax=Nonomuraea sp. NPDC051941 TaxID=3364373 RepID=UPI0037C5EBE5